MVSIKPDRRVLVTGSSGFTGRYMCEELQTAGYRVFGVGIQHVPVPGYFQADLQDLAQLSAVLAYVKPDVVIHLAALAFVGHGDADAFYQVNLLGTRNLLEAIAACDKTPDCVLLASSANVYGNQIEGVLNESTLPAPANDYAVSKLAMEYMARTWQDKLPIVIVRPFNYTGVGQAENFLLPKIVNHFRHKANVIELGNLDVCRDFSDVRSVVSAYRHLIETCPAGQTFNVASGQTYALGEILSLCEEITGHHITVRVNSAFVRSNEVKTLCGDASRLKACIGPWDTQPLRETLKWMLTERL
jgi:nucleoside-diphosphate-sugar epimerase